MKKAEKWFMIILWTLIIGGLVVFPICMEIKYRSDSQKLKDAREYNDIFMSVGVQYEGHFKVDIGPIEYTYFLEKESVSIDEGHLQLVVNAYNLNTPKSAEYQPVTREEITEEFNKMLKSGKIGEKLKMFSKWEDKDDKGFSVYTLALGDLLDSYRKENPDFKIEWISDLTLDQVNKLDAVYKGEKKISEIEL